MGFFYKKFGPEYPWRKLPRPQREKEEREYGEYRTRRLILEVWDKLETN